MNIERDSRMNAIKRRIYRIQDPREVYERVGRALKRKNVTPPFVDIEDPSCDRNSAPGEIRVAGRSDGEDVLVVADDFSICKPGLPV